jgi:hypothetical protein
VLSFFWVFYLFSFVFFTIIDDNTPNSITSLIRDNFDFLWIGLAVILTFLYLFWCYKKNKKFNIYSIKLLIVFALSCLISGFLVFMCSNSSYWFFKYTIGCFVGSLFYFFNKKEIDRELNSTSGIVSIFVLLFGENFEYFLIMDPPNNPSILYSKSFSNTILWFATIGLVFVSAYLFSKGILINKIKKHQL